MPVIDNNSKTMQKLRSARSLREIMAILTGIEKDLKVKDEAADDLLQHLSKSITVSLSNSGTRIYEQGDLGEPTPSARPKNSLVDNIDVKALDVSFKELVKDSDLLGDLRQRIHELKSAKSVMLGSTLGGLNAQPAAVRSLDKMIDEAEKIQNKILRGMHSAAKNRRPKIHNKVLKTIINTLIKGSRPILDPQSYSGTLIKSFILHPNKDELWFQSFIYILDFVNTEGYIYHDYAFVLTTIVDIDTGEAGHRLTSVKEDKVPGEFPAGTTELVRPSQIRSELNQLLSIDDFTFSHDRRVMNTNTTYLRRASPLGNPVQKLPGGPLEVVDGIRVKDDVLYVRLAKGLSPEEEKDAVETVVGHAFFAINKGIEEYNENAAPGQSKKRLMRGSMMHRVITRSKTGRKFVEIKLYAVGTKAGQLTRYQLNAVTRQLGLTPDQVKHIKQAIK